MNERVREPHIVSQFYLNYAAPRAFGTPASCLRKFFGEYASEFEAKYQREITFPA